jgi:CRISPR-associated protein Csx17
LLNDLDASNWLSRFRQHARKPDAQGKNFLAPRYVQTLALRLDETIFAMAKEASCETVQSVLIAIGEIAAYLGSSPKARDPKEAGLKPPPRLRPGWFDAADDGTPEFCIATALAGLGAASRTTFDVHSDAQDDDASDTGESEGNAGAESAEFANREQSRAILPPPFRAHLAPLGEAAWYQRARTWGERGGLVVWGSGSLERSLIAILERRLVFDAQRHPQGGPFIGRAPADLTSVLAFIASETVDAKIARLAQGLAWADTPSFIRTKTAQTRPMPLAYALLKPFFAPVEQIRSIGRVAKDIRLPIPLGLIARLRAGDVGAAIELACRRAQASGLPVTFEPRAQDIAHVDGPRLLAGLLIPVRATDLIRVMARGYPALFEDQETPDLKEDSNDAA